MVDTCGSSGVQQICNVLSYLLGGIFWLCFCTVLLWSLSWGCLLYGTVEHILSEKKVEKTKISRFEVRWTRGVVTFGPHAESIDYGIVYPDTMSLGYRSVVDSILLVNVIWNLFLRLWHLGILTNGATRSSRKAQFTSNLATDWWFLGSYFQPIHISALP